MFVYSVKLVNFKSFGDYAENEIKAESDITAIIGMNESGKSNVIDGLSRINFFGMNTEDFTEKVLNRSMPSGTPISYIVTLKPTDTESTEGIHGDTIATFDSYDNCFISGGLLDWCKEELFGDFHDLSSSIIAHGKNPFSLRDAEYQRYKSYIGALEERETLNFPFIRNTLIKLKGMLTKSNLSDKTDLISMAEAIILKLNNRIVNHLPIFYQKQNSKVLKSNYQSREVESELAHPEKHQDSLLSQFVDVSRIAPSDFVQASLPGSEPQKIAARRRVIENIETWLNPQFRQFYNTEESSISIDFNSGIVTFMVKTNQGETLALNERSNGLKWALELYLDISSRGGFNNNRPLVYLLDEPGVFLHINAQKTLLNMFQNFANSEKVQLIYTTHSPYMLNIRENLYKIRAAVKDERGFTKLYTAYNTKISESCQNNSLTPIIEAIGMSMNSEFGPSKNRLNVVTEGISDYIYLTTMSQYLSIGLEELNFIPSVGAPNVKLLCEILLGWNCPYLALFDYDNAGVRDGEKLKKDLLFEYKKQYCYVADVSEDEVNTKSYRENKVDIEDIMTRDEISRFCSEFDIDKDIGKTLISKLVCEKIMRGEFIPNETACNNFRGLLNRLSSYRS